MKKNLLIASFIISLLFCLVASNVFAKKIDTDDEKDLIEDFSTLKPKFNLPIPTIGTFSDAKIEKEGGEIKNITIPWIAEYIIGIYKYALIIGSILAIIMIILGGFLYMVSGAKPELATKGKKMIFGSLSGLVLLLGAFLILNITNPELTSLKAIELTNVPKETFSDQQPYNVVPPKSKGPLFEKIMATTEKEMNKNIVNLVFLEPPPGSKSSQKNNGGCHKLVKPLFEKISTEIMAHPQWPKFQKIVYAGGQRPWIYNWRCNAGCKDSPTCDNTTCIDSKDGSLRRSYHSYGVAIDLAPKENPLCMLVSTSPLKYGGKCKKENNGNMMNNIPTWVVDIFHKNDFIWGGSWKSLVDPMHFEWAGNKY